MASPPLSATPPIPTRRVHQVLAVLLLAILAVSVWLLQALWARSADSLGRAERSSVDSALHLAFQLEKEFLRLRHQIELAQHQPSSGPELQQRIEIFLSRIDLLSDNPSTAPLQQDASYRALMPRLQSTAEQLERLAQQLPQQPQQLGALAQLLDAMGSDLQSLVQTTNRGVLEHIQMQERLSHEQDQLILLLTSGLLLFLLAGFVMLFLIARKSRQERRELQTMNQALDLARLRAEDASQAKSRFLANMSHELRTPFNGLLGMLQVLEQTGLSPTQQQLLGTATESARHLLQLLNDILDLSALDAGRLTIRLQPVDVCRTVQEVVQWMRPAAEQKGLQLQLQLQPHTDTCPHPLVEADATRIRQVLLNLISNAIKFTAHGQVSVRVQALPERPAALRWQLQVQDSGAGMGPETLQRLFQRFQPGDESTTRTHGGAGLGLQISRALAQRMGGDIRVHSRLGVGSTFSFEWTSDLSPRPAFQASAEPSTEPPAEPPTKTLATAPVQPPIDPPAQPSVPTHPPASTAPLAVLVVEDHPVNRLVLSQMLAQLGHTVEHAENGEQGLQKILARPYALVLMDLHMPVMDGFACVRAVRAQGAGLARLSIVAVTADVLPETQMAVREAGFSDFLTKPLERNKLQACLDRWCAPQPRELVS